MKRRLSRLSWLVKPAVQWLLLGLILLAAWRLMLPAVTTVFRWLNPTITQLHSYRGRTNFLLLGVGGEGHDGGDLTDSLILLSVNVTSGDAVLLSLPRDIWVKSLAAKLNTAYHYGEAKQPGGGLVLAKASVAEVINQPVHYGVVLDFSGFERLIDILGGIEVEVPRGFTDSLYPIPGKETAEPESKRYETIEFKSGKQHFDGATVLKYVRSRHAEGEEGTDYARAQRQQRVILAVKNELLKPANWLNLKKIKQLQQALLASVNTDITGTVYPDLVKLAFKIDQDQIRTGVIDQGSQTEEIPPLLYNPPVSRYGQWVLLPAGDDWEQVYQYVAELLYQNQSTKE